MGGTKILVLGGTGPSGICLLRELVYRKHETIAYARNPSKIPEDLASDELLEVRLNYLKYLNSLLIAGSLLLGYPGRDGRSRLPLRGHG
jgi:uncharacterized protein YbjT (DUF2867 family)